MMRKVQKISPDVELLEVAVMYSCKIFGNLIQPTGKNRVNLFLGNYNIRPLHSYSNLCFTCGNSGYISNFLLEKYYFNILIAAKKTYQQSRPIVFFVPKNAGKFLSSPSVYNMLFVSAVNIIIFFCNLFRLCSF